MKRIISTALLMSCVTLADDTTDMCSEESTKQLSKLELKGETRFSDFKFDTDSSTVSEVEFTDMGEVGRRRRGRRHRMQTPAKPEFGHLLIMKAQAKEKNSGWRNLLVKCGVNRGKIATFTYEILPLLETTPQTPTIPTIDPNRTASQIEPQQ